MLFLGSASLRLVFGENQALKSANPRVINLSGMTTYAMSRSAGGARVRVQNLKSPSRAFRLSRSCASTRARGTPIPLEIQSGGGPDLPVAVEQPINWPRGGVGIPTHPVGRPQNPAHLGPEIAQ